MASDRTLSPRIVRLDPPQGDPVFDRPRADRLEAGNPLRQTWSQYESGPLGLLVGQWACEVGRWRIAFPATKAEYFFVLEGHVRLHDAEGGFTDVVAGQGAVIPAGFEGAFEVLTPVRKHFVVIDQPEA